MQDGRVRSKLALLGVLTLAMMGGLVACGLGDATLEEVDPDSLPATVTYTSDVGPRIDYYCVACHGGSGQANSTGSRRHEWDFSTYELVKASFRSIEESAIVRKNMPPGGARRLTARDAAILLRWRDQGYPR